MESSEESGIDSVAVLIEGVHLLLIFLSERQIPLAGWLSVVVPSLHQTWTSLFHFSCIHYRLHFYNWPLPIPSESLQFNQAVRRNGVVQNHPCSSCSSEDASASAQGLYQSLQLAQFALLFTLMLSCTCTFDRGFCTAVCVAEA